MNSPQMPLPAAPAVRRFRRKVLDHYRRAGRVLPWRRTDDPYAILVSEIMLQQTQVDRVIPKYCTFIRRFPSFTALARAPISAVLAAWQGLGYNRRALLLLRCAHEVVRRFGGRLPDDEAVLRTLPGIGPYTAGAVMVFAYRRPAILMETNIRAVFIHEFFPGRDRVSDDELLPLIRLTVDRRDPRRWYDALMDYGSMLKRRYDNPARRSAHYVRPVPFHGSTRQLRGRILRCVLSAAPVSVRTLVRQCGGDVAAVRACVRRMIREGLVAVDRAGRCSPPGTLHNTKRRHPLTPRRKIGITDI